MAKIRIRDPQTNQIREFEIPSFNVDLSADSVFSPTSPNPQSGIAVMQAIEKYASGGGSGGVFVPPVIYVEPIENGNRVNIVYDGETIYFDVLNGIAGEDGTSVTHYWEGTTLTVTSASGTSSANLKGEKGEKGEQGTKGDKGDKGDTGYTPVRGTDYWTEADKAEIKGYVDEAILGGAW